MTPQSLSHSAPNAPHSTRQPNGFPRVAWLGLDGILVTFAEALNDPANTAALAFAAALRAEALDGVEEVSPALVSTFLRFDAVRVDAENLFARVRDLAFSRDWGAAGLPAGRSLWRVPAAFEGAAAPQLAEAAGLAGLSPSAAIAELCASPLRVLTIGFAPGQPYLGQLPPAWQIPRQTELTAQVPAGALCSAIRQMTVFSNPTPTGWRQVGRCALRLFDPQAEAPFLLCPGDEVVFEPVAEAEIARLEADEGPKARLGGAEVAPLP